ncbi:hypothetical protein ACGF07_32090 [Kitasatospora sp. NPDC048194]|uniref:hypothetical protein n=1 Tax=Kitasatospora sp. NPDC048194 TaxID=3364045 RepID=UPI003720C20C
MTRKTASDLTVLNVGERYARKDAAGGVVSTLACAGREFPCHWTDIGEWHVKIGRRTRLFGSWPEVVTAIRKHVHRVDPDAVPRTIRQREEAAATLARFAAEVAAENAAAAARAEQAAATLARAAEATGAVNALVDEGRLSEDAADYVDANYGDARRRAADSARYVRERPRDWQVMARLAASDAEKSAGRCIELAERFGLMTTQAA